MPEMKTALHNKTTLHKLIRQSRRKKSVNLKMSKLSKNKTHRQKDWKNRTVSEPWNNFKQPNIQEIKVHKRVQGDQNPSEEIMAKFFSNLMKTRNSYIQEVH